MIRNLWRHQHRLLRHIDKFLEHGNLSVSPGILYLRPPVLDEIREQIESHLEAEVFPLNGSAS